MRLQYWGTRGSIPSPGDATWRYGGNTTCIEVVYQGDRLILDAGTGIRRLGDRLLSGGDATALHILLTHCHWDHIHGLPFFTPLRDAECSVTFWLPPHLVDQGEHMLSAQFDPIFFPADAAMRAQVSFRAAPVDGVVGGFSVRSAPVSHPGGALAYRVAPANVPESSAVFAPDSELDPELSPPGALVELCAGASVLIHDAMYSDGEYEAHRGWGHSTPSGALRLALLAGARRLALFHHHPDRSDTAIDAMTGDCSDEAHQRGGDIAVSAAAEGDVLAL